MPHGDVDGRDIREIKPHELEGYSQVHLFAGIGGWNDIDPFCRAVLRARIADGSLSTTVPVRVQRKRTKGFRLRDASPNGLPTVYVGRPTIFGNPFHCTPHGCGRKPCGCCEQFKEYVMSGLEGRSSHTGSLAAALDANELVRRLPALMGKNLACWCPLDQPCHADVLLEVANRMNRTANGDG